MAAIEENKGNNPQAGKKAGRNQKNSTRVDMTPMVDLAFLLLTFFVLTSTFSKPKVMSLVYPAKEVDGPIRPTNNAITFLLTENRIFYYAGQYYPADNSQSKAPTVLQETDFSTKACASYWRTTTVMYSRKKKCCSRDWSAKRLAVMCT